MSRIVRTSRWLRVVSLGALLAALPGHGQMAASASSEAGSQALVSANSQTKPQTKPQTNPQTVTDVLHQMSDRAGVIFMGQVLAVQHHDTGSETAGTVEVEFRVDQAIRGCTAGTPYVLREWGGIWAGRSQRYRVGQRLLMLLHAPSPGGMSSPVDDLDGAIPIRQGSTATPPSATSAPPALPFVDLRWLGVKVPRAVSYRTGPAAATEAVRQVRHETQATQTQQQTAYAVVSGTRSSVAPIIMTLGNASPGDASIPDQQASVNTVLGLLTTWQKAPHVTP